jgi:hypothetical protein
VDYIKRPYTTIMRFGTDAGQVAQVQWYFCQPGALPLGIPTCFCSRNVRPGDIDPDVGEVQFAPRLNTPGVGLAPSDGQGPPFGDPDVWRRGYQGTVPPLFPRNPYGVILNCGSPAGQAAFGVLPYIPPGPLLPQGLRRVKAEEWSPDDTMFRWQSRRSR